MNHARCLPVIMTAILSLLPGCTAPQVTFENHQSLSAPAQDAKTFQTATPNGEIVLQGRDTNLCSVHAHITGHATTTQRARQLAENTRLEFVQDNGALTLLIHQPKTGKHESVCVSLTVTAPAHLGLSLRSSNGRIEVSSMKNSVHADTSNGAIEVCNIDGPVNLHSSNGRIETRDINGPVNLHSSNGQIIVRNVSSSLDLRTSNGQIDARQIRDDLKAHTSNGDISIVYGELAPNACDIDLHTSNGHVEITLPSDYSAHADIATSHGSITSDQPISVTGPIKNSCKGTFGAAEASLKIRTSNGSIHIH